MKKIFISLLCLGLFSCADMVKKSDDQKSSKETVKPSAIVENKAQSPSPIASTISSPIASPIASVGIPNPAAVFCIEQGGKLDIRKTPEGDVGYCTFEDKSECEEWAFFRGECKKGQNKK
jgi:putative hemolysin